MEQARSAEVYAQSMNALNAASRYADEQVSKGKNEYFPVSRNCADRADVMALAAKLSARGSPMAPHIREALAKCCDMAMSECQKRADPELQPCIEACKRAAADCRQTGPRPRLCWITSGWAEVFPHRSTAGCAPCESDYAI